MIFAYPLTEPDISPTFYEITSEVNAIGCGHRIKGSLFLIKIWSSAGIKSIKKFILPKYLDFFKIHTHNNVRWPPFLMISLMGPDAELR